MRFEGIYGVTMMKMMIAELYDALLEGGTSEEKARAAASAIADYKDDIEAVKADLKLLKWMLGFNMAFTMSIVWKIFS